MALRRREILNKIVYQKHRISNPMGDTVLVRSLATKLCSLFRLLNGKYCIRKCKIFQHLLNILSDKDADKSISIFEYNTYTHTGVHFCY